ncbi:DUF4150 domain-containing protein [Paracoccus denitrificans]|jgi:hypothetical protein|uniref:Uncharacterized protein n=1 Tax=Paracoccus denitrificans (strain Pd 1222) TaxID=318586 RepID=A1B4T0_PARDP|nr:DUF4150 domain-containing protein [Paracoccus denitrificans]ABL70524.1 hypothetical protein Pden_2437 [Paracoccus denitrificans PD1222]MBB4627408.1 hypothetical protein [Paracoccus denitrificans]MCU7431197.1 DUF4150 domain-containing protein [Paracoccus denitrificans]QAR25861.1 DUF4150 domain-containing protein [Paracoccus denitrificans]UPV94765.1 DUF4150 domain-containing protein [Paracoccus denitrificans]
MSGVFANGLEISGKAVNAQTIAAFPDTCFTPPENPATPPGVPVPYPSFGVASDTENGTGTVFIGGKTVNIKNKSDVSRTSGTEAGCAAKKGIITSKNTGKKYFNSWSNDVKFDGEPVIRFSDLATHNHASPGGQTPPWAEICAANFSDTNCVTLLNDLGMQVHEHGDSPCNSEQTGKESEHPFENQMFQQARGGPNYKPWGSYDVDKAPCVCMQSRHLGDNNTPKRGKGSKKETPHNLKTTAIREYLADNPRPTLGDAIAETQQAYDAHHECLQDEDEKTREHALECLKLILLAYLQSVAPKKKGADGKLRPQTHEELLSTRVRSQSG